MKTLALLLLLVVPFGSFAAEDQVRDPRAREAFDQALELMDQGVLHLAVDRLNLAIGIEPHPEFYLQLGRNYRALEERKLAYFAYRNALRLEPASGEAMASLADLALEHGSAEEIEGLLPALRRYDPAASRTAERNLLLEKGDEALTLGRWRSAHRFFSMAADLGGEDARTEEGCFQALSGLAEVARQLGNLQKELEVLLRLYRLRSSLELAERIGELHGRGGADVAELGPEVESILEHARELPR